ncbi:putative UspA-family protein [Octadecabacter antarcticus 307]|uniref:Putative UspA-family protein n=1 Tax=Octadecabacter antarcticus 307 TaxID=391626 RepID=M9R7U9_9RHOB|nr:universal stress protein [Octadecabacter antarcticus]AGI68749.1 putative UspA-family protein [Octadecabacter antarcticus 307]
MTNYAKMRISNPSPYYETPDLVLKDGKLNRGEKEKVLRSMASDANQMAEATIEGMEGGDLAYNANDLQAALIQLEKSKELKTIDDLSLPNARFQQIMVVTTVDQDLNRDVADIAYDMAEVADGKVYLLNVVPSQYAGAGLMAAGPMMTSVPLIAIDNTQIIADRTQQLAELRVESGSSVETEIEVRGGQIEQVIADYADECDADIIVVGSPNRSWLEALLDSSITRRVTKSAPCPVLVVPEPA